MNLILFTVFLPVISFLYASTGHGGATAYLALMALSGMEPHLMRPTALVLNVFVSAVSFLSFYRNRHFRSKLFLPFALGSIPMAWLGGMTQVDLQLYRQLLAVCLALAALRILGVFGKSTAPTRPAPFLAALGTGAAIGYLSGLLGIGGGIILSPVILLMRWGSAQEAAAVSALFILVNSLAGLLGLAGHGFSVPPSIFVWIPLALVAGWAGAQFGSGNRTARTPRGLLAAVLLSACIKLLWA